MKRRLVQLFIQPVLVVVKGDLFSLLDGVVNDFNIVKQGLVFRLAPLVHRIDILHMRTEVLIRQAAQAVDQIGGVLGRDIFAAQHPVNEHAQLGILEPPAVQIATRPPGFDVDPGLLQQGNIPADGLSLNGDAVFLLKMPGDVLLRQRMVIIAVLLENLQDTDKRQLFWL